LGEAVQISGGEELQIAEFSRCIQSASGFQKPAGLAGYGFAGVYVVDRFAGMNA
jgi:hypothetical protein